MSAVTVIVPSVNVIKNTTHAACRGCERCKACKYWCVSAAADVAFALRLPVGRPSLVTRTASTGASKVRAPFASAHSSTACLNDQFGTMSVHHSSTFDVGSVGGNFCANHL